VRLKNSSLLITLAVALSSIANSQTADPPKEDSLFARRTISAIISRTGMIQRSSAERGIAVQGQFVQDLTFGRNDIDDNPTAFSRYSLDVSAALDGKRLFRWAGSDGFVRLKNHQNEFGQSIGTEAQLFSNIDAPSRTTLYEVWFEQRLKADKLRIKLGKIDANTEFAVVQGAGDFLNSSMGYSPTILSFPTYPEPKFGVNVFLHPLKQYALGLGAFRTSMGTLSIVEPGRSWALGKAELPGRVSAGYWRLDGELNAFDGSRSSVTQGFYSVFEQAVWRQVLSQDGDERRLSTYLQFAHADGRMSPFTDHLGSGAVLQAPFERRSHDSLGFASTWVRFSSQPGSEFDQTAELILEGYYKISLSRQLALVSDFQFFHHPGGLQKNRDGAVVTPRLVVSF